MNHSKIIASEIERDVIYLKKLFKQRRSGNPTTAKLGYVLNSHHGRAIFEAGDRIAGLRVKIDMDNPQLLMVIGPEDTEAFWR